MCVAVVSFQGWQISEDQLVVSNAIASGVSGVVYKGQWGHIPVAIKAQHAILVELDPSAVEEFEKEASLMQSIKYDLFPSSP